jgi:hypothetical protein
LKENFDRFRFLFQNLQGELRMADFRKYALAIAGVACLVGFTGAASAQTLNGITCFANAATPLQDRAEGITELVGDLVLTCTGGTQTPQGALVPTVNITVALNTQVTSRLVGGSSTLTEAVLLLNDFQSGAQVLCPATTNSSCATVITGTGGGGGKNIAGPGGVQYVNANVYQGILSATNQLTFFNVPIDPPGPSFVSGTQTITPTLSVRITNVRANASALGAPTGFSTSTISESISTSAGIPITGPLQTVGSVFQGLVNKAVVGTSTTASTVNGNTNFYGPSGSAPTLTQCSSKSLSSTASQAGYSAALVEYVNFSEGFATATKLRYSGGVQGAPTPVAESTPGNSTNVEGGFILNQNPTATNGNLIGAADWATRVKLTFGSIQNGVTIYVPLTLPSNQLAGGSPTEIMTLTAGEAVPFNAAPASTTSNLPNVAPYLGWAAVPITSGGGVAVYEVTSQQTVSPNTIETFSVPVLVTYTASPATNSPGLGTSTVQVDFAPSSTVVTAQAAPVPRFVQVSPNINGYVIAQCATNLLFPFVTNQAGYDTGLAIASTSSDPFGTALQSGTCTLNFYGSGAPAAFVTPTVTAGTVWTGLTSNIAAGFQGYMIAQCKFQYGHGFAFIKDGYGGPGQGLSEGYLALIIPDTSITSRAPNPNVTTSGSGEILSN